ncbi:MAG TPA: nuclear transport factor 2 family protein [Myxococcaceae bacterium]
MHQDKLEILELLNSYILGIDTHDAKILADHFHEDATYVSPFGQATGSAQILETVHKWHSGGITAGKRHMMGAWKIDVQGDRATSQSSYWVVNAKDGTNIVASGGYEDEITRKNGVWRGPMPGQNRPASPPNTPPRGPTASTGITRTAVASARRAWCLLRDSSKPRNAPSTGGRAKSGR